MDEEARELLRAAETSGAEQGEKYYGRATEKQERHSGAGWEWRGARSFSQPSPFTCLPLEPGPKLYDTNDTEGQLRGEGERSRFQRIIYSLQGHGFGKLLGVLRSSSPGSQVLVPVPVPQCPRNGPSPRFSW